MPQAFFCVKLSIVSVNYTMNKRINNRREQIVQTAMMLFTEQGYRATSTRQIADAVGCTEAALYYHFKGGKRELFAAVVETALPNFFSVLQSCQQATSLQELVMRFGIGMKAAKDENTPRMRWVIAEFNQLTADEQTLIRQQFSAFESALAELIQPFVATPQTAAQLAWFLIISGLGFAMLFDHVGIVSGEFDEQALLTLLTTMISPFQKDETR